MTNRGDFRRYSYNSDASYALDAFSVSRTSAAPAYEPEVKKDLKIRENKKRKSKAELVNEQRAAFVKALGIFTSAMLAIAMLFGMLYTNARKNELNHEIANLKTELSVAESEGTRINSELNALVSMNMIDEYAVNNLGMSKMRANQIRYIDVSQFTEERKAAAVLLIESQQ